MAQEEGKPRANCRNIQPRIGELITTKFSTEETAEIQQALVEAQAEFDRGESLSSGQIRAQLGLL